MAEITKIELTLRGDGRWDVSGTFMGRPDASYVPLEASRLPQEVVKLARELQEQTVAELRRQAGVHEAAVTASPR